MNTFGSSSYQFALYDPRSVRSDRQRFRRDAIPLLSRANSLYVSSGRTPSCGYLLLSRYDYNQLDKTSTTLQLHIGDPRLPTNVGIIGNLSIVQAQCVTRGLPTDPAALYLVEVTDGRGIVHNPYMQFPLTAAFNIRSPAYPQVFQPASMNGGTTWTWATMLEYIWTTMGAFLGPWPGLPSAPAGTPEGFWFVGVSAWESLCDILDTLGMTVAVNLTSVTPFTIVPLGATDLPFTLLTAYYAPSLEDDLEWIDVGAARVPASVKVLFRRRNSVYGTEETTPYRNDIMAQQWNMLSFYTVVVPAPAVFTGASGTHYLWSDFTVRADDSSNPLNEDITLAQTIAAERVTQYFAKIYHQTLGFMTRTYAGALPFSTGSQVDGVAWVMDHPPGSYFGWRTKLIRGGIFFKESVGHADQSY